MEIRPQILESDLILSFSIWFRIEFSIVAENHTGLISSVTLDDQAGHEEQQKGLFSSCC